MDLGEVAERLYGLPSAEFIAARDAEVKAARSAGDRELAAAIGGLRRPTAAAWLVNRLARERADWLARLAELGVALRTAHRELDGAALRELAQRRQALVGQLIGESRELGRRAAQAVSEPVARELEEMFTAALADADAARALACGRLASAKDLGDESALSWPDADPAARPKPAEPPPTTPSVPRAGPSPSVPRAGPSPAAVTRARSELDRLTTALADAEAAADRTARDRDAAAEAEAAAHRGVADLRAELAAAERREQDARARARTARRSHEDAERALRDARRRRDTAAQRLAALTGEVGE